jgi:2-methylisocitrate lyase-like PEP mutase family enzyme
MDQVAKAQIFQALHRGPEILVVANAWDAASARVFEHAGMRAIGTGSAGIAFSHGYPDNERIPREVILAATREIVDAVKVPVTADILTGLGGTVDQVVATVKEIIAMGAVGINIEDGTDDGPRLFDLDEQAEKIRAVCKAVKDSGVPIVVNARTDSFWLKLGDEKERLRASIERANRYREAGADCPPLAELEQLGVRRVSEGSGPMRATMMLARRIAEELLQKGTYASFHNDALPYPEANKLFE